MIQAHPRRQPTVTISLTAADWRDVAATLDALPTTIVDPAGVQALCHELAANGLFDNRAA